MRSAYRSMIAVRSGNPAARVGGVAIHTGGVASAGSSQLLSSTPMSARTSPTLASSQSRMATTRPSEPSITLPKRKSVCTRPVRDRCGRLRPRRSASSVTTGRSRVRTRSQTRNHLCNARAMKSPRGDRSPRPTAVTSTPCRSARVSTSSQAARCRVDGSGRIRSTSPGVATTCPSTQVMTTNGAPVISTSSHTARTRGTGTALGPSAERTRASRMTSWAPGG